MNEKEFTEKLLSVVDYELNVEVVLKWVIESLQGEEMSNEEIIEMVKEIL